MTAIRRSALVSHSAHEMFALVADIPSYPQFLPWWRRRAHRVGERGRDDCRDRHRLQRRVQDLHHA